jgi:small subunit ribosomal protein S20
MPITQSAKKAVRGSLRKKAFNDARKRAMKEIIKKIERLAKTDDKAGALKMLPSAFATIDKAAKKGVIKKNNAAHKKSRLAKITR